MRLKESKLFQDSSVLQDQGVRNCVARLGQLKSIAEALMTGILPKVMRIVAFTDILAKQWVSQSIQTIFPRPNIKYFPVKTTSTNPVTSDRLDHLISDMLTTAKERDEERHLERHRINNNESTKDTPWLNRTGWKRMFADRDMKMLVEKTSESLGAGEEPLKELSTIVADMIEEGYQGSGQLINN